MHYLSYIALALFVVISFTLILLLRKEFENRIKKDFGIGNKEWNMFHKVAVYRPLIIASAIITISIMLIIKAVV